MIDPHQLSPPGPGRGRGPSESSVLVIEGRDGARLVVPVGDEEIVLGRAAQGSTVRLPERDVSRRHARFTCANGAVWVEDLGSSNGIRINGERIQGKRRLREGDLVQLGGYDIALLGATVLPPGLESTASAVVKAVRPSAETRPPASPSPSSSGHYELTPSAPPQHPPVGIGAEGERSLGPTSRGTVAAVSAGRANCRSRTGMLVAAGLVSLIIGWTAGRFLRLLL